MLPCHYLMISYELLICDLMQELKRGIVVLRHNHVMEYDWGSSDQNCLIKQLRKEEHQRYAELWMGTHPKGASKINQQQTLAQYLSGSGEKGLPFLYKILCIEKALSIQLHPNKKQAEKLHIQQPNIYDDNEKPEMFLTLTQFECLFGIISSEDLQKLFTIAPYSGLKSKGSNSIKQIIVELLSISADDRKKCIEEVLQNIQSVFPERSKLLNKLQDQFPYDQGILVSCLLKYKVIAPGNCFAIAAGIPHAYIQGSCLEIMKNSDNVVRLGLTPKLKDVKTMLEIMNDQIGIDGLSVEKTQEGYIWNNLVLNPVEVKDETVDLDIAHQSIGIVFSGQFTCEEFSLKAKAGEIFFAQPGRYRVKGPFSVHFGGYSYQHK